MGSQSALFYLTLTITLIALISSTHAYPVPSSASLGIVLPLSGPFARTGVRAKAVIELLNSDLAGTSGKNLPGLGANPIGCPLNLKFIDSSDRVNASRGVMELYQNDPNLYGVIADIVDATTQPISLLTSALGVVTIGPTAVSPSYTRADHPYFFRSVISNSLFAQISPPFFDQIGWKRIIIFSVDDDDARGYVDTFIRAMRAANSTGFPFEIHSIVFSSVNDGVTELSIKQALKELYNTEYRIFTLYANNLNEKILRLAHEMGMIGEGADGKIRQWTGPYCTSSLQYAFRDAPQILAGSLCLSNPRPRVVSMPNEDLNAGEVAFEQRLRTARPDLWNEQSRLAYEDIAVANSFTAFVALFAKVFNDPSYGNTGAELLRAMSSYLTIVGQNGKPLTYLPSGDPFHNPDFAQWDVEKKAFVTVSSFDLMTGTVKVYSDAIFMSGTTGYPKDRARIYITGDDLPTFWDGKVVVLTYVVAVLGAWTSLILTEQTLSFWSRGGWKQALGWTVLSAIAYGTCSIFPTFVMSTTALELDSDATIWFKIGSIVGVAIYPAGGSLIAFAVGLLSVAGGLKPAANVNVNEVSDISATSETSQHSNNSSGSSSSNGTMKMIRSKLTKALHKARDFIDTIVATTWRLPLSAIILAAVMTTEHLIFAGGFYGKLTLSASAGILILGLFVSFVLNLIALIMYFHVTRSGFRYLAPFILAGSALANYFIVATGTTFRYNSATDISSEGVSQYVASDTSLAVIIAVICAGICLFLMAFNVNRLRVSRNALDKVLSQVASQVRGLESEIDHEKSAAEALGEQADFFRRTLEVINLCRPIWRPYSIAMALADPDENALSNMSLMTKPLLNDSGSNDAKGTLNAVPRHLKKESLGLPSSKPDQSQSHSASSARSGADEKLLGDKTGDNARASAIGGSSDKGKEKEASASKQATAPTGSIISPNKDTDTTNSAGAGEAGNPADLPGATGYSSDKGKASTAAAKKVAISTDAHSKDGKSGSGSGSGSSKSTTAATKSDWQRVHAPKQSKQLAALLKELAEMGNLEGPVPSKTIQDLKLPQILSNPATLELMKDVLAKNLSPENIALWIDVQRYRSLDNVQVRKAVADEIFQTFIVTGAKYEVNLSSFMKDYVQTQIYKGKISIDLFDEVEREIYRLMVTNNVDSLVTSQMFKLTALLLQHPQYKLKSMSLVNNVRGEIGGNVPPIIGQQQQSQSQPHPQGHSQGPSGHSHNFSPNPSGRVPSVGVGHAPTSVGMNQRPSASLPRVAPSTPSRASVVQTLPSPSPTQANNYTRAL